MLEFTFGMPRAEIGAPTREVIWPKFCNEEEAEEMVKRHFKKRKGIEGYYTLTDCNGDIIARWHSGFGRLYKDGEFVVIAWL